MIYFRVDHDDTIMTLSTRPPPPPPRRRVPPVPLIAALDVSADVPTKLLSRAAPSPPDLSVLLARKPPPPPFKRTTASVSSVHDLPDVPSRRVSSLLYPPELLPLLPPPPPLNLSSKPIINATQEFSSRPVDLDDHASCLQCRDFSGADALAALFPRQSVVSLTDLVNSLIGPFDADLDKARVIFTWLHYNIAYDAASFLSGNVQRSTPSSTLSSGLAVCEGYAGLFKHLAELAGLQAHTVSGHGKGYGYQSLQHGDPLPEMSRNHAWNCVLLEGEWQLIDPCWGAGILNGTTYEPRFAPKWFIASPIEFGHRHFPSDPTFHLSPEQTSWEDYILAPEGPQLTSDFDLLDLHPLLLSPSSQQIPDRQFITFSVSKRCEHMSTADVDNYVFVISTTGQDFIPLAFNHKEGAWTSNIFTPRNGKVTLYAVDRVGNLDGKGLGINGFIQAKGRKAMGFKGLAMWSVVHL